MRSPRFFSISALLLGAVLLATGCRGNGPESELPQEGLSPSLPLTDALGRRVPLKRPAQRAVSLAPNLTEIAFFAGAGRRLVGVTTADDYPPAVDTLTHVQAHPQIDFEAITALQPDLVLATDQVNAPRDAGTLEKLDVPTYFFSFSSMEDVFGAVETTGRLLGTPKQATRAADSLRRAARHLRQRTAQAENRPLVLFLIGDQTLYTFAEGSYMHQVIRWAGGKSATADLATNAPLSEEFVLEAQPDVIVGAFGTDYDPERLRRLHPSWEGAVPALQNERVFSVAAPPFLRPGPRTVKGAHQLAQKLHPSLFADSTEASRLATEAR